MREGFHWSSENLHEHASFIDRSLSCNDELAELGWTCRRVWYLSKLSDTPKWTARIEDMSLEEWWPWPKAAAAEGEEAPNAAQEVEECRMI